MDLTFATNEATFSCVDGAGVKVRPASTLSALLTSQHKHEHRRERIGGTMFAKSYFVAIALTWTAVLTVIPAEAQEIEDGTYSARVRTDSGTYSVPVEVVDGQVARVQWPNGGRMRLRGADVYGDSGFGAEASGRDLDGNRVTVEIEDPLFRDEGDAFGLDDPDFGSNGLFDNSDEEDE